ncbi:uncharacterized protein LOC125898612 [Epinephelus fuscoguttatus]|uniref:uncharacterized protein LOC125898612 n=1 Tax=Epinephelus fuscoguttatus TaxID=293821 RepID=UPI0020D0FA7F|nr:uncharacterized protein LOC125898612 [Epinephelus fuscoguttatus]
MKKSFSFFPGRMTVSFRKGPSGHLRQDPSDEAMRIKKNPSLQDKSPPQRHDLVRSNALTAVLQRGGDVSDRQEVMGEYMLQFGKYKGKPYRWLLENDVGYTIYLINKVEEEERAGTFNPQGNSKDSLLSFLDYARSFQEIEDLREYLLSRKPVPPVSSEGDNVVGFGARAKHTWRQIWESREDGYAAFIVGVKCVKNSKMYNLQQYLLQQQRAESLMEEDEELERAMLNLPPSEFDIEFTHRTKPTATATVSRPAEPSDPPVKATVKTPLPVPPQLLAIAPQLEEQTPKVFRQTHEKPVSHSSSSGPGITAAPCPPEDSSLQNIAPVEAQIDTVLDEASPCPAPPVPLDAPHQPAASVPGHDQDVAQWNCSQQQKIWMKTEMEALGLWPGSRPVRHLMNMLSLWRYPPQPELIDSISELPSPKYFQLHPFFIWKPEHTIMERVRNNYILPCLYGCPNPQVASSGVGRPRVVIGTSGQYYILASRLTCKACKKYWHADKPQWLEKLPERFSNIVPAFLTHKKAICKSVMDEMRRSGRSPEDMSKQLTEALHLKYERAHLAYLLSVQNVRDGEAGVYAREPSLGSSDRQILLRHLVDTQMQMAGAECLFHLTTLSIAWSESISARSSSSLCCFKVPLDRH